LIPELDSRHPEVEAITASLAEGVYPAEAFQAMQARIAASLDRVLRPGEALIVHNVMTMPFNLPLTAALCQRRMLAWTHDLAWPDPRHAAFQREGWPWRMMAQPLPAARYVTVSEVRREQAAELIGIDPGSIEVIPNGIDALGFHGLGRRALTLARRADFATASPLILVPLRITRRKRLELGIEAAARLVGNHPRLRVVITGPLGAHSADNRAYFEELLALRSRLMMDGIVVFCHQHPVRDGHPVTDQVMAELYRLADAVLIPSESEGFGLPLLEAGLLRLPVVAADIPVLREAGGPSLVTFPVEPTPDEVATALAGVLESPAGRQRRRVVEAYSWDAILPRIESLIEVAV
jgi:glycosyltransferase involved in cell wall biosynthesis